MTIKTTPPVIEHMSLPKRNCSRSLVVGRLPAAFRGFDPQPRHPNVMKMVPDAFLQSVQQFC